MPPLLPLNVQFVKEDSKSMLPLSSRTYTPPWLYSFPSAFFDALPEITVFLISALMPASSGTYRYIAPTMPPLVEFPLIVHPSITRSVSVVNHTPAPFPDETLEVTLHPVMVILLPMQNIPAALFPLLPVTVTLSISISDPTIASPAP